MSYVDFLAGAVPQWAAEASGMTSASGPKSAAKEQRTHPRRAIDQHPVQVVCSYGILPAEMLNLSLTGAKVKLLAGFGPNAGEEVTLRLADGVERHGAVAWIDAQVLGISLRRPLPRALD